MLENIWNLRKFVDFCWFSTKNCWKWATIDLIGWSYQPNLISDKLSPVPLLDPSTTFHVLNRLNQFKPTVWWSPNWLKCSLISVRSPRRKRKKTRGLPHRLPRRLPLPRRQKVIAFMKIWMTMCHLKTEINGHRREEIDPEVVKEMIRGVINILRRVIRGWWFFSIF